jgi:hypothetical protein
MKTDIRDSQKEVLCILSVILLCLYLAISAMSWMISDARPLVIEDLHMVQWADALHSREERTGAIDMGYPPVLPTLVAVSYALLGLSDRSALFVNVMFFPILILSLYLLGNKIAGRTAGLISAGLASSSYQIIFLSRTMFEQFALTSLFAFTLLAYIMTDRLRDTRLTIVFALASSLSLMTRYSVIPTLAGVWVFIMIMHARDYIKGSRKKEADPAFLKRLRNTAIYGLIVMALVLPWYIGHVNGLLAGYPSSDPNLSQFAFQNTLLFYPYHFIVNSFGLANSLLLAALLLMAILRRKIISVPGHLLSLFFFIAGSAYLLLTLSLAKNAQSTTVVLVPFFVLFGYLAAKSHGMLKAAAIILISVQFLLVHAQVGPGPYPGLQSFPVAYIDEPPCYFCSSEVFLFPGNLYFWHYSDLLRKSDQEYHYEDLMQAVAEPGLEGSKEKTILIAVNDDFYNPQVMRHNLFLKGIDIGTTSLYPSMNAPGYESPIDLSLLGEDPDGLKFFSYILTSDSTYFRLNYTGSSLYQEAYQHRAQYLKFIDQLEKSSLFVLVFEAEAPQGYLLRLYRRVLPA